MPTYEYRCRDCQAPLEVVQSIHDAALTECPQCRGQLRKVFGNVGVVFKGSGFYRTDSRKGRTGKTGSGAATAPATAGDAPSSKPAETPVGASASGGSTSAAPAKPAAAPATSGSTGKAS